MGASQPGKRRLASFRQGHCPPVRSARTLESARQASWPGGRIRHRQASRLTASQGRPSPATRPGWPTGAWVVDREFLTRCALSAFWGVGVLRCSARTRAAELCPRASWWPAGDGGGQVGQRPARHGGDPARIDPAQPRVSSVAGEKDRVLVVAAARASRCGTRRALASARRVRNEPIVSRAISRAGTGRRRSGRFTPLLRRSSRDRPACGLSPARWAWCEARPASKVVLARDGYLTVRGFILQSLMKLINVSVDLSLQFRH